MIAQKNTVRLSIPKTKDVRGYTLKKMPLGPMLDAIEGLQELPGDLFKVCFPGMDAGEMLKQLKTFDADMLTMMLGNALTIAPKHIVKIFAKLSGIPDEQLLEDPEIGFDGLAEMMAAWLEVNGIENFITAARVLAAKVKAAAGSFRRQTTGSKGSLQTPKA